MKSQRVIAALAIVLVVGAGCGSDATVVDAAADEIPNDASAQPDVGSLYVELLPRISPCDLTEDDSLGAFEVPEVEAWFEVLSADDKPLEQLETREALDGASYLDVSMSTRAVSSNVDVESALLESASVGLWHAAAIRAGLEAGATVYVATDEFDVVSLSAVYLPDGSVIFGGGLCASQSIEARLSAIHGDDLPRVLQDMTAKTGAALSSHLLPPEPGVEPPEEVVLLNPAAAPTELLESLHSVIVFYELDGEIEDSTICSRIAAGWNDCFLASGPEIREEGGTWMEAFVDESGVLEVFLFEGQMDLIRADKMIGRIDVPVSEFDGDVTIAVTVEIDSLVASSEAFGSASRMVEAQDIEEHPRAQELLEPK